MAKKGKQTGMGSYSATKEELNAAFWCVRNNIKISPEHSGFGKQTWRIVIELNNKVNKSKDEFGPIEIWKKLYEYCIYYHSKYGPKKVIK